MAESTFGVETDENIPFDENIAYMLILLGF